MVASVALGGLLTLGDRRELPMLTPHCHFAVFPQCRHFPEGAAGGREAEEEGGEAEGDPQGPAHLPLAVGAVAQGLVPHGGGDAAGTWSSSLPLGGLGPVPGSPLSVCAVGFVLLPFFFCLAGAGGGAGVLPQWGWVEPKWGTPSSEPEHRREGSQAIPWAGRVLKAVVG